MPTWTTTGLEQPVGLPGPYALTYGNRPQTHCKIPRGKAVPAGPRENDMAPQRAAELTHQPEKRGGWRLALHSGWDAET